MIGGHEDLRTTAATLAAAAARLQRASGAKAPFSLAFLTDCQRIPDPEPILRALPAGVAVIYRNYDGPGREAVAHRYAAVCRSRGVLFLVAGDLALAQDVGADGLHLPARSLRESRLSLGRGQRAQRAGEGSALKWKARTPHPKAPRAGRAPGSIMTDLIVTASCHNANELALAHAFGADIAFLSPVFPTKSHAGTEHLGAARFLALAAAAPLPVLGLGGVDETNATALSGRNVAGFGAIGAFA